MSRRIAQRTIALAAVLAASSSIAQTAPATTDPTSFATAAETDVAIAAMEREMKPDQGFLWRPLVRAGGSIAALEYWRKPGLPAVHPTESEYAIVLAGAGSLVSGGQLLDPVVKNPGLTEGSRIENGTTRPLRRGDVVLIPAGVPHWFGVQDRKLVLLGIKLPPRP